jgi:hypothetical protein
MSQGAALTDRITSVSVKGQFERNRPVYRGSFRAYMSFAICFRIRCLLLPKTPSAGVAAATESEHDCG